MYNLMIIDNNSNQLVDMVNYICEKIHNVRICYISHDMKNISNILKKNNTDIILLDINSNDITPLIEYIKNNNLYQYRKSIILKLGKINDPHKYKINKYVFSYTNKITSIPQEIRNLISYKNNTSNLENIKNKIKEELINLNYNYSYKGTKYLEETILEIYKVKFEFDGNLSKNIYSIIAKRHQKNIDTVYENIKHATSSMISKCDREKIIDYFGYSYYFKPKIQEIIFTILHKIDE